jgi:hypothetical protein
MDVGNWLCQQSCLLRKLIRFFVAILQHHGEVILRQDQFQLALEFCCIRAGF